MAPRPPSRYQAVRLLYVLDSLAPGGAETSTVLLAGELVARGVECMIATLEPCEGVLAQRAASSGVRLVYIEGAHPISQIRALRRLVRS